MTVSRGPLEPPGPPRPGRYIWVSNRAKRSLKRIGKGPEAIRIQGHLWRLQQVPLPENLDIVDLQGRRPWKRYRVGDWRIIFRPMTMKELELKRITLDPEIENEGFFIESIEHKSNVDKVIKTLTADS